MFLFNPLVLFLWLAREQVPLTWSKECILFTLGARSTKMEHSYPLRKFLLVASHEKIFVN